MDTRSIMQRDDAHVLHTYGRSPVALVSGAGMVAVDAEGKQYLDFTSGIGVNALGFCHPAWVAAVSAQAGTLQHTSNLAAIHAAELGQKVTVIEREYIGGVCLNVGCIPLK